MAFTLELLSPVGSRAFTYKCLVTSTKRGEEVVNAPEVVEMIRLIGDELPEIALDLASDLSTTCISKSPDDVKQLAEKYNKQIGHILKQNKSKGIERSFKSQASKELLRHIIQLVYNQAVTNPDKLNQYVPFSPGVYGESSFELITQVIEHSNITENDVFIDLGSGVGQVVLQIAGSTPCKFAWGVELAEWPSKYAEVIDRQFRHLMKWWGKSHGKFKLIKGDFLDEKHAKKIKSATVIFVNNFAFGPQLDHQLSELFKEAVEGTRIISSKAFCPLNFRITHRSLNHVGCIMRVTQLPKIKGAVSWTGNAVTYFLHVIDRTRLYQFFENRNNPKDTKKSRDRVAVKKLNGDQQSADHVISRIEKSLNHYLDELGKQLIAGIIQISSPNYRKDLQDAIGFQQELLSRREFEANSLEIEVEQLKSDCLQMIKDCYATAPTEVKNVMIEIVKEDDELMLKAARLQEEMMDLPVETSNEHCPIAESRKRDRAQFEGQDCADNKEHLFKNLITGAIEQISSFNPSFDTPRTAACPAVNELYEPFAADKLRLMQRYHHKEKVVITRKIFCPVNESFQR